MLRAVAILVMLGAAASQMVDLDQGRLQGKVDNTRLGPVTKFLGIPYVAPPVGMKRFHPPTAHQGWEGTRDATNYGPNCIQKKERLSAFTGLDQSDIDNMQFSEDCLHVNVFIPGSGVDANAKLPVMVWIHGGHFLSSSGQIVGTTSKEKVDALAIKGDVIVVTLNYRLNVFGFFTLGDDMVPGNQGIMDQVWALKWVKMNIAKFGGDPWRVTLFGDECGGKSVQLHMFNEYSYGLFQRAAISSGATTSWAVPTRHEAAMKWFYYADHVGCGSLKYNKTEVAMCLQGKSTDELLEKLPDMLETVVIDGYVLKDQPAHLIKKGHFAPVELIIGCNSADGDMILFGKEKAPEIYQNGMPADLISMHMDILSYAGYPKSNTKMGREIQMLIGATYFQDYMDPKQNLKDTLQMLGDAFFLAPAAKLAYMNMMAGKPTYMYIFEHESPSSKRIHGGDSRFIKGAGLGSEVWYIMGDTEATSGVNGADNVDLMDSMINAWSSFAKTGQPQYIDSTKAVKDWPECDMEHMGPISFMSPMNDDSINAMVPKGALYFSKMFPAVLKVMYMDEMMMEKAKAEAEPGKPKGKYPMGEPEGEMEWPHKPPKHDDDREPHHGGEREPHPEGEREPHPEAEHKHKPGFEAHMMKIASWVMFGLVCLLVLLMFIVCGVVCTMCKRMRKGSNTDTNPGFSSTHGNGKYA